MLLHWGSGLLGAGVRAPIRAITHSKDSTFGLLHSLVHLSTSHPLPSLRHASAASTAMAIEPLQQGAIELEFEGDHEEVNVKELEDLPEQWRRSKVAWLCKELPSNKHSTFTRLLNAQRKWLTQDDVTYIVVHFLRIRENEAGFRVYKWMVRQHWYNFDFTLATKLADFLGKDRKFSKCREVFDEIIRHRRVPSESSFHVLTVAYLSVPVEGCLEEACSIYNRMIQLGGYRPRLSLHNALFRALISKPGKESKHYLKQAEFIFHNLETSDFEIQKDIYAGLIWLHSYQDVINRVRIEELREEMRRAGFDECNDVLVSILRACSKEGDLDEAERAWSKLLELDSGLPSQAFVYRMELYAKIGEPMRSLEMFRGMSSHYGVSPNVVAYQKIIEVMSKARDIEIAESVMAQFTESGMKPLAPSFIALMDMYFNLNMHDKLEAAFSKCLSKCSPNRIVYSIYLESLVRNGKLEEAEEIFKEMHTNEAIGTNARTCNITLGGFLASGELVKAKKLCELMCQKKYDIEPAYMEKIEYVLSLKKKVVKKLVSLKLDKEQREILIGLLLGGVLIESDDERRNHAIHFVFRENSSIHSVLKVHIHERYYEWLSSYNRPSDGDGDIPCQFSTITHLQFSFFADQLWTKGKLMVPKLIHRWLSARALAYWYMYGGLRTSSNDIILKLKAGRHEDVERIVRFFLMKSLDCRVKKKGRAFWIGFQGRNAVQFWDLIESYVLDGIKEHLKPGYQDSQNGMGEEQIDSFDTESDSDSNESSSG